MTASATLVIETSTPTASLGLFHTTWQEESFRSERSHNCEIFLPLQSLCSNISPGEIHHILIGTGPGSYSGTRVGLAVAQGLAIAHDCPVTGIPSILGTPTARSSEAALAIGDARRGDWWWAWLHHGKMSASPQIGSFDELLAQLETTNAAFSLDEITHPALAHRITQETPTAHSLWQAWQELTSEEQLLFSQHPAQPLYLKPPHITTAKPGHPLLRRKSPPPLPPSTTAPTVPIHNSSPQA